MKTNSPQTPAAAPSKLLAIFLPAAPDRGAAVLLALGAELVDDELEGVGKGEVEEEDAAKLEAVEVAKVVGVDAVEVTTPSEVEVTLVMTAVGVGKGDVSVIIAVGTESVEAKPSVEAKMALLIAEDTPASALEAATEAVVSAL